mmetsp:Transcript_35627/g.107488  ORF Transcript_35627/g.107488 Transcript_35627/m.107488 type:complete len:314 (+) Transcript_35627:14-955(+)
MPQSWPTWLRLNRTMALQDQEACVICCGVLAEGAATCRLPCGHSQWHKPCVRRWLVKRNTCPVCRAHVLVNGAERDGEFAGVRDSRNGEEEFDMAELLALFHTAGLPSESSLFWEATLDTLRNGLALRMSRLEEDRRWLEQQVQDIEADLDVHRAELERLRAERLAIYVANVASGPPPAERSALQDTAPRTLGSPHSGPDGPLKSRRAEATALLEAAQHPEPPMEDEEEALAMFARLQGAVRRAAGPASAVFHALAPPGVDLMSPYDVLQILREFEGETDVRVAAQVFALLDINGGQPQRQLRVRRQWLRGGG